jgi:hypothetical protein
VALDLRAAPCDDLVRETPAARPDIARALRDANGNVAAAARSLGVPRTTLRRRIAHTGEMAGFTRLSTNGRATGAVAGVQGDLFLGPRPPSSE